MPKAIRNWFVMLPVMVLCLLLVTACDLDEDDDDDDDDDTPMASEFFAGAAQGNLDVSVGTPLAGFTGRTEKYKPIAMVTGGLFASAPKGRTSPFADVSLPSIGIHTAPNTKALAMALKKGSETQYLIFARVELCTVTDALRRRVELLVSEELGFDATDHIILAATHTHAGPGRHWPLPYFAELSYDTYDPSITERMARSITDVVTDALDQLRPAKIGMTVLHGFDPDDEIFMDRRPVNDDADLVTNDNPFLVDENGFLVGDGKPDGPMKDDRLTMIRVDADNGTPIAAMFSFPVHGIVLPDNHLFLSGDLMAWTESKVSEAIGKPSPVVMSFQGSLGDTIPVHDWQAFQQGEKLAEIAALRIHYAYEATKTDANVDNISMKGATIRQDRELLGYDDAPYPYSQFQAKYGAALCGVVTPDTPWYCLSRPLLQVPDIWYMGILSGVVSWYFCQTLDLCEEDLVEQVVETYNPMEETFKHPSEFFYQRYHVARLQGLQRRIISGAGIVTGDEPADVFLLSQPGEPLTTYNYQLRGSLLVKLAEAGVTGLTYDDLVVVGISQDSFGYLMPRRDWLHGAYEISINTWGPLWGDYVMNNVNGLAVELATDVETVEKWPIVEHKREDMIFYQTQPVASETVEAIAQPEDGDRFNPFTFSWTGGDPGVDHPIVTLQRKTEDEFEDVTDAAGRVITSDGYQMILLYNDFNTWEVFWELTEDTPDGTYRFAVRGNNYDGKLQELEPPFFTGDSYELTSDPFDVAPGSITVQLTQAYHATITVNAWYPENRQDFKANNPDHFRYRPIRPSHIRYLITFTDYDNPESIFTFEGEADVASDEGAQIDLEQSLPDGRYTILVKAMDLYGNQGSVEEIREFR